MKRIEHAIESILFASRWLMVPVYLGLAACLLALVYTFGLEIVHTFSSLNTLTQHDVVLAILSLIDLSLAGNLVLIVIYSGYENFVSKLDAGDAKDWPDWKGSVDFSKLKLKLIASIVAISAIQLLKAFMSVKDYSKEDLLWMVIIHVVFVVSGVLLAVMDWVTERGEVPEVRREHEHHAA